MICRGHIRAIQGCITNFSIIDSSMVKLTSKSTFSNLSSFQVEFERVVKWGYEVKNHIRGQSKHGLWGSNVEESPHLV